MGSAARRRLTLPTEESSEMLGGQHRRPGASTASDARSSRIYSRGVLSMIEMSCPRCGAGGRVPNNKVNSRLVCKKCLQIFHLTPSGHAVLGEPPPTKEAPSARGPRERVELDLSALEGL